MVSHGNEDVKHNQFLSSHLVSLKDRIFNHLNTISYVWDGLKLTLFKLRTKAQKKESTLISKILIRNEGKGKGFFMWTRQALR